MHPEEVQGFRRARSLTKQTAWNFCHCWREGLSDSAALQSGLSVETTRGQGATTPCPGTRQRRALFRWSVDPPETAKTQDVVYYIGN